MAYKQVMKRDGLDALDASPAGHLLYQVPRIGDVSIVAQADPKGNVGDKRLCLLHVRRGPGRGVPVDHQTRMAYRWLRTRSSSHNCHPEK